MNKRAQGLPINFIVIAALAILILILAAGFVIGGGASVGAAMGPQQARNTCQGYCNTAQQSAAGMYDADDIVAWKALSAGAAGYDSKFCTAEFDVEGQGTGIKCFSIIGGCKVTFGDGQTYTLQTATCP